MLCGMDMIARLSDAMLTNPAIHKYKPLSMAVNSPIKMNALD